MCCRLTAVPELRKPLNQWCEHCAIGEGCKIYDTRPHSCRTFECVWLSDPSIPETLKPDICKVVFERLGEYKIYLALIGPHNEDALRKPAVVAQITKFLQEGFSIAVTIDGGRKKYLFPAPGCRPEAIERDIKDFAMQTGVLKKVENGGAELYNRPNIIG
jgi:hypothetical protein